MSFRKPPAPTNLDLIGAGFWAVLIELHQLKENQMALAETLAELQAEDTELAADVAALVAAHQSETEQIAALQQQIADLTAAGTATPEQLVALQTVADDLATTHNTAVASLPPAP